MSAIVLNVHIKKHGSIIPNALVLGKKPNDSHKDSVIMNLCCYHFKQFTSAWVVPNKNPTFICLPENDILFFMTELYSILYVYHIILYLLPVDEHIG
jgi:hypothetical protein